MQLNSVELDSTLLSSTLLKSDRVPLWLSVGGCCDRLLDVDGRSSSRLPPVLCWRALMCPALLVLLQDAVSLCDATGNEFARGLSNFDSQVRPWGLCCQRWAQAPSWRQGANDPGRDHLGTVGCACPTQIHTSAFGAEMCVGRDDDLLGDVRSCPLFVSTRVSSQCEVKRNCLHSQVYQVCVVQDIAHDFCSLPPPPPLCLSWMQELLLLQGKHTSEFAALLGYATDGELMHRGNLALLLAGECLLAVCCVLQSLVCGKSKQQARRGADVEYNKLHMLLVCCS